MNSIVCAENKAKKLFGVRHRKKLFGVRHRRRAAFVRALLKGNITHVLCSRCYVFRLVVGD